MNSRDVERVYKEIDCRGVTVSYLLQRLNLSKGQIMQFLRVLKSQGRIVYEQKQARMGCYCARQGFWRRI